MREKNTLQFLVNKFGILTGRFAHSTWASITVPFFISCLTVSMMEVRVI